MNDILIMIIYILLIILLGVGIALGIKLLMTITKVNEILDDVEGKMKSLDKLFDIVSFASDRMSILTDSAVGLVTSVVGKFFGKSKRRKKIKEEEEDEEDE